MEKIVKLIIESDYINNQEKTTKFAQDSIHEPIP